MIPTLNEVAKNMFMAYFGYSHNSYISPERIKEVFPKEVRFLELPMSEDTFEVPIYFFEHIQNNLRRLMDKPKLDMVFKIEGCKRKSNYTAPDNAILDALNCTTGNTGPLWLNINNVDRYYFGTRGTLFDHNFCPIVMPVWKIQAVRDGETIRAYDLVEPILRIAPEIMVNKDDRVRKFIIDRLVPTIMSLDVEPSTSDIFTSTFSRVSYTPHYRVSLRVEPIPFVVRTGAIPNINTTDALLRDVALSFIDDIDGLL